MHIAELTVVINAKGYLASAYALGLKRIVFHFTSSLSVPICLQLSVDKRIIHDIKNLSSTQNLFTKYEKTEQKIGGRFRGKEQ